MIPYNQFSMIRRSLMIVSLALPLAVCAQGPVLPTTADTSLTPDADDPVLQRIDELSILPWIRNDDFVADRDSLNRYGFAEGEVPTYTDEEYRERLLHLDEKTPFKLTYNKPVKAYINLYAQRRQDQTARMLGLAELYFPVFEEALDRYQLPMELKYLAVVESALNPGARSRAAAVGLWQFIIGTGKMYGLRVDSYVDERCDVYKSTDAACRYLKDLYDTFGDWELALAAYNCGPGNVRKAIRRAGGTVDYWKVYDHLPRETRGYVPAFIAVNYIFNHAAEHNIFPILPNYCAYEVDTMHVRYPLELDRMAALIGADTAEVRNLNPVFKAGVIPEMEWPATVYIPATRVTAFLQNEDTLSRSYEPDRSTPAPATGPAALAASTQGARTHIVRSGESLGLIAQRNRVRISDLRRWNNIHGDRIRIGQRLVIHAPAPHEQDAAQPAEVQTNATPEGEYIYHTIQPGDTLWDIAHSYPGVTVEDLKRLNGGLNFRRLTPGKKIKVGVGNG